MEEPFALKPDRQKTIWILWSVLLISLGMYTAIGFFVRLQGNPINKDAATLQVFLIGLLGLSLISILAIFLVLPRILLKPNKDLEALRQQYFTYSIGRWVMSETICVYGLVYHFIGGQNLVYLGFLGVSVLMFLLTAPTQRDLESYARAVIK